MDNLGLMILTVFIMIVVLLFFAGVAVDFISPSALQVQLFGIQVTLMGVLIVVAGYQGYGFAIGVVGLLIGMFGTFRDPSPAADKSRD
ncbi:hypothetical protein [Paenibacillus sacheonensis]|uniref:Uncharacterized protein n=1 Tax=Paenibacillus sacheonensis TaxID=742054 RepID=A0A7X4YJX1_9BACL|nr:hypothetical protein [Paenibacillus sacheonensis]MBM7563902.1 putative membrane chloride channel (bestrophin family) [Paenibacillus sacheonensis]NBC67751.1 hypothetical protein [Paenibacillus sacheonensis]